MLEKGQEWRVPGPYRIGYRRLRQKANALIRPKISRRSSSKRIMLVILLSASSGGPGH
jgi:hypothetical protein